MIELYRRFLAYLDWRKRDQEEFCVHIERGYGTQFTDTGRRIEHTLIFCVDGNGFRYCRLDSPDREVGERHKTVREDRQNWHHFGVLPRKSRPTDDDCWKVLGLPRDATEFEVRRAFREQAKKAHPDAGGSAEAMAKLSAARDAAMAQLLRVKA